MGKQDRPDRPPGAAAFDPAAFLGAEAKTVSVATYKKGAPIFAQGDAADAVFFLKNGTAVITVVSSVGKEGVVAILSPGQFFGEGCLIGQPQRLCTTTAVTKCVTLRVAKTDIQRLLHERPEFAQSFILLVLARKARVEEDLLDQLFNSTERRLARVLLLLANIGKEGGPESTAMQVSQEVLAKMIGATRSQVSHFMNKFRRLGLIEYNGNIQVHSSLQSTILNGMPDGA